MSHWVGRVALVALAFVGVAVFGGCRGASPIDELLIVYSGECQAFVDPCG